MIELRPDADHKKSGVNYERLGHALEDALILDYVYVLHSTKRQIWSSFVRGLFAGIGATLGATLGVAALVAFLQLFGGTPVIGHFLKQVGQTIENRVH